MFKISFANGKKLTPAIAISAQGLLFEIGSFISLYLGAILSSLWAFLQPIFLFYFISSGKMTDIFSFYKKQMNHLSFLTWFADKLIYLISFCIFLKILIATTLVWVSKSTGNTSFDKYQDILNKPFKNVFIIQHQSPTIKEVLLDLFKPFYLISMVMIVFFELQTVYSVNRFMECLLIVLVKTIAIITLSRYGSFVTIKFIKNNPRFRSWHEGFGDKEPAQRLFVQAYENVYDR